MSSPEERWWSVRAGEYVLGTLRGRDLELFERILSHDTAMQEEVSRWERRLAPLDETTLARSPGSHVLPRILERIRAPRVASPGAGTASVGGSAGADAPRRARRGMGRRAQARPSLLWPAISAFATAASLMLAVLLHQRTATIDAAPLSVDGLAVVLSDENGQPYFLVETDYGKLRVRVTALTPPSIDGERNFQLWQALPDRSAVRAVALLPRESGVSRTYDVGSLIDGSDLFGVSIEPAGAPTEAGPTGPVVAHGDFLPKRDGS